EDPHRAGELFTLSDVLAHVRWKAPETFYQAVQFLWLVQAACLISHGMAAVLSIGRADQYLYPFYKRDIQAGRITPQFARELLEELLIKLSCNLLILPEFAKNTASELGADNCAVTVGGVDRQGNDAANELTDLFFDAICEIRSMTNSFSIRVGSHSSQQYLEKTARVFAHTSGPAVFNDDVICAALSGCGYSAEDARDYSVIGCVEPAGSNDTFGCTSGNDVSLVGVLEMVFTNGRIRMMGRRTGVATGNPARFSSFDQVLSAFRRQLAAQVALIAACVNEKDRVYMERFPNPAISMTLTGCLESGRDMTAGGARYNFGSIGGRGLATTADSLCAVKKAVFEEKWLSMAELVRLLDTNFRDAEDMRLRLLKKTPKYGNDDPEADAMAGWVAKVFCEEVSRHKNIRGGPFRPGFFSYGMHVYDGMLLGATPNGRRAGEPVSNSLSPSTGSETKGPTAVINSYASLCHSRISNGSSLNIRLSPSLVRCEKGEKNLAALLAGFVKRGAMHVQFNVVDDTTLRAAQANPENYTDLVVRVSGYCAYFTDLGRAIQEDVIRRIAFDRM
ncbi:MAG: glycyl radical protein, partial [Deltaproteobacteria bacterium]|nr:glycyl radical protein [Deltaproteobacteria bacterium]